MFDNKRRQIEQSDNYDDWKEPDPQRQSGSGHHWITGQVLFGITLALLLAIALALNGYNTATFGTEASELVLTASSGKMVVISDSETTYPLALEGSPTEDNRPTITSTLQPTLSSTPTPIPSATPSPTPTATPTVAAGECYLALDLSVPPGTLVTAYPDPNSQDIVAQVKEGEWYRATGQYHHANGTTWFRIEVNGVVGWVPSFYYQFDGRGTDACSTLETVAIDIPPTPTITPGATLPIPPGIDDNSVIHLNQNVPAAQVSVLLSSGSTSAYAFGIRVNDVPVGEWRNLDVWVTCESSIEAQPLGIWGVYGESLDLGCGSGYSTNGVTLTHNFFAFQLVLPQNVPSLTYVINARLY